MRIGGGYNPHSVQLPGQPVVAADAEPSEAMGSQLDNANAFPVLDEAERASLVQQLREQFAADEMGLGLHPVAEEQSQISSVASAPQPIQPAFALAPKPSVYGAQFLEGVENTKLKALYQEAKKCSPSKGVNTDYSIQFKKEDSADEIIQPQNDDSAIFTIMEDGLYGEEEDESMMGPSNEKIPPKGRSTPPKTKRSIGYLKEREEYERKQALRHPDLSKNNY